MNPFYTIGHSTRDFTDFAELLKQSCIERVVDVRTVPRSRTNPQFNQTTLPDALGVMDIQYEHLLALGGLRSKSKTVATTENGFWKNTSFHNYADYALSADFDQGLAQLTQRGSSQRCVIMCAEVVWWRCHRRIVADYLLARGFEVLHIMGAGRLDHAQLTCGAVVGKDKKVRYPEVLLDA